MKDHTWRIGAIEHDMETKEKSDAKFEKLETSFQGSLEELTYKYDLGYRARFEKIEREMIIPGLVGKDKNDKFGSFRNFVSNFYEETL